MRSSLLMTPDYRFFREGEDLRRGTFAPFFRASLRPMAIACFRLFTLRPEPLLRVPFFLRWIADLTRLPAALPYLAISLIDASVVLMMSLAGTSNAQRYAAMSRSSARSIKVPVAG